MKSRRLVAVSMLLASLAVAGPSFADGQQPDPGPQTCSVLGLLLDMAAYGIEISGSLL